MIDNLRKKVLGKINYNIDIISNAERFGIRIEGWACSSDGGALGYKIISDTNEEIAAKFCLKERPDVAENIKQENVPLKCGFSCDIDSLDLLKQKGYKQLTLQIRSDDYYADACTIDVFEAWKKGTLYLVADGAKIIKSDLFIQGWFYDVFEEAKPVVLDDKGNELQSRSELYTRNDISDLFGLDKDYRSGFKIYVNYKLIHSKKIYVCIKGRYLEKKNEIDAKKLIDENKWIYKFSKAYGFSNFKENLKYIKRYGFKEFRLKLGYIFKDGGVSDYEYWFYNHRATKRQLSAQRRHIFKYNPLISIVIPLYNTPIAFFDELISCIINQTYSNWQLCLADASDNTDIHTRLKNKYFDEPRIKYIKLDENKGISENTNEAIKLSDGDYIMFSDHDDLIEPDTLYEMVKAVNEDPKADLIYTDEDKVSIDGKEFFYPHFKPDYNPFLICSNNYICHILVVSRDLVGKVGMLRKEFDGAQDYDFVLRCAENTKRIRHIPKVLYHWRTASLSTAEDPKSKLYAFERQKKAIEEHYKRIGIPAKVSAMRGETGQFISEYSTDETEEITVIVPFSGSVDEDIKFIKTIRAKTNYENYKILYCAGKNEAEKNKLTMIGDLDHIRFLITENDLGFSAMCNKAALETDSKYIVLLDKIKDILNELWLKSLYGCLKTGAVRAAGAKLATSEGLIFHAGIILGIGSDKVGAHVFYGQNKNDVLYMNRDKTKQNLSAVSSSCIMLAKEDFLSVGGFDEELDGIYRSIDLCLKLRSYSGEIVYDPAAELITRENTYDLSYRGEGVNSSDCIMAKKIRLRWGDVIDRGDPYYNPNLTRDYTDYSVRY